MIFDSDNFLELGFISIKKTLSSSGLNIDLELQVFNAVDSWLCHDIIERGKFTNDLFSKVRLPLLSIPALKQILDRVSSNYNECSHIIRAVLLKKQQIHTTICKITSKYCNLTKFNIKVCEGKIVFQKTFYLMLNYLMQTISVKSIDCHT